MFSRRTEKGLVLIGEANSTTKISPPPKGQTPFWFGSQTRSCLTRQTIMNTKRQALAALLFASAQVAPAHAGCFDWLFGKAADPAQPPYTVGYAPTTVTPLGPPVPVGAPIITSPATTGPAAAALPNQLPYSASYAPQVAGQPAYSAPWTSLNSAAAAQAPAYAAAMPLNNANVLTGRPVVPVSGTLPAYSAYYGAAPAAYTAVPTTQYAYQPAAVAPVPQPSGVASWFGKYFGQDYRSSYYNVPTTLYRPVTQLDPATGQMVTVQQPCTTTTQQLQRSPYSSLQPAPAPVTPYYGEPVCGSEPPRYSSPTVYPAPAPYSVPGTYSAPATYPPAAYAPPAASTWGSSGVSQATAVAPLIAYGAQPMASSIPSTGYPAPVTSVSPYPSASYPAPATGSGATSGDTSPMAQPELRSRPAWPTEAPMSTSTPYAPSLSVPAEPNSSSGINSGASSGSSSSSLMQAPPLLPPASSTGSGWSGGNNSSVPSSWPQAWLQQSTTADPVARPADAYSSIPPIPAASDYRAPAWSESKTDRGTSENDNGGSSGEFTRSNNPPSFAAPRTASSRLQAPTSEPLAPIPTRQKRDDSGWVKLE